MAISITKMNAHNRNEWVCRHRHLMSLMLITRKCLIYWRKNVERGKQKWCCNIYGLIVFDALRWKRRLIANGNPHTEYKRRYYDGMLSTQIDIIHRNSINENRIDNSRLIVMPNTSAIFSTECQMGDERRWKEEEDGKKWWKIVFIVCRPETEC